MKISGLNPCCSGQWSRTFINLNTYYYEINVLILVVVDNGLVLYCQRQVSSSTGCLNPCCSGQWSRTLTVL